jgi:Tol biopolymer transport system component
VYDRQHAAAAPSLGCRLPCGCIPARLRRFVRLLSRHRRGSESTGGGEEDRARIRYRRRPASAGAPRGGIARARRGLPRERDRGRVRRTRVTQPPEGAIAADGSPSVSPDGKTIAFARAIPGESPRIYLVAIDGSGLRRLTQGNSAEIQPVWSPDGTHIAFSRADGEHFDLFVAGADGSAPVQLTHTELADEDSCTWSPNGLQLAFTRFLNDDEDVLAINVDGSAQHPLIRGRHDDASPSWSPEGSRIAITRDGRIAVFTFEHFKVAFLTEAGTKGTGPNWSPDGSRIVFTRDPGSIFVMNADGSKLAKVPLDKPATAAVWEPAG